MSEAGAVKMKEEVRGRKSSYTPEKADIFLKRLRGTEGNVHLAATSLSLTTGIISHWRRTIPEFGVRMAKVVAEVKSVSEARLK